MKMKMGSIPLSGIFGQKIGVRMDGWIGKFNSNAKLYLDLAKGDNFNLLSIHFNRLLFLENDGVVEH